MEISLTKKEARSIYLSIELGLISFMRDEKLSELNNIELKKTLEKELREWMPHFQTSAKYSYGGIASQGGRDAFVIRAVRGRSEMVQFKMWAANLKRCGAWDNHPIAQM